LGVSEALLAENRHPATDAPRNAHLDVCPWHNCCVSAYQVALCQWYWDLPDALRSQMGVEDAEADCPNVFYVHEYRHIGMVLEGTRTGGRGGVRLPGFNSWGQMKEELPLFPAAELFYSRHVYDNQVGGNGSLGLYDDREEVEIHGRELWRKKGDLMNTIARAEVNLEWLEESLGDQAGVQWFAEDPMMVLRMMRWVRTLLRQAQREELQAAESFRGMMRHAGYVFTVLGKMPAIGESVIAANGSYTVSREQLDLAHLDAQGVIDACDGPLKLVAKLKRRAQLVEDVLCLPKKIRSTHSRKLRVGAPIPAMPKSMARKYR
jgi:hypothetical protein